jgi:hypothetical protein
VTRTWSKVLAMSVGLLGVGYVVSGVLLPLDGLTPNAVGFVLIGFGLFFAATAASVWRDRVRTRVRAAMTGLVSTAVFSVLAVKFEHDPDATDLANNIDAAIVFGLAGLSALVLATVVILAVVESMEARHQRTARMPRASSTRRPDAFR